MTLEAIRDRVLYQTANDADDLPDFEPHLSAYINEGYDKLLFAHKRIHAGDDPEYPILTEDSRENRAPNLPEWTHQAIADYATWMVYRNGNALKQQRGMQFYQAFSEVLAKVKTRSGSGTPLQFTNIYP